MEFKQFNKRHSERYDRLGSPITIWQKRERISILFIILLLIGICIVLYPYLGNAWNNMTNTYAVTHYRETVARFSQEEIDQYLWEADEYNKYLANLNDPFTEFYTRKDYNDILNIDGQGMMGYVNIPKINVRLAIYHGFADSILDKACGHLEGSSFPVGGVNTHAVISAHRGLPSAKLFSELNRLVIGDTFSIEVLDRTLYYRVDQIKIVDPDDTRDLQIIKDEDHLTLLTCTPYGINTHRLLVRGVRTDNPYGFFSSIRDEAVRLDPFLVCLILFIFILLAALVWSLLWYKRRREIYNKDLDEMERQTIVKAIGEFHGKER